MPAAALPTPFDDLLTTRDVDDLLSRRGLRTPFLRVARDGHTLADADFTRGGGVGAGVTDQLDDTALLRLFAEGHTLVLQGLHRTHPPVLELAQDLAADLGHPVQVNAYVTPPSSRGFAAHYDVHDVFVLQTAGEKRWRLHAPVQPHPLRDQPWQDRRPAVEQAAAGEPRLEVTLRPGDVLYVPVQPHPLRDQPWQDRRPAVEQAAAGEPRLEVTLRPGDVLYVPRGWLHSATALGGVSMHLTVGIHVWHRGHVAEAVLEAARRGLAAQESQRTSLRPGVDVADPEAIADDLAAVREALLQAVADVDASAVAARLAARQRAAQRPAPVDPVGTVETLADGFDDLAVAPRAHLQASLETGTEGAVLVSRAGRLHLTDDDAAAVTAWLADEAPAVLDPDLARRLVVAGVAVPAAEGRA